jgi:ATP-dependent protease ClpP protease subunit
MAKVLKFEEIKKQGRGYSMQAKAAKSAEIYIYDDIGDYWGDSGITAKQFVIDLKALGELENLDIHINSLGGQVFEGLAIYNNLVKHPAYKMVFIDGIAASITSVIAMSGDKIIIADNAQFFIHRASGINIGNSDDMERAAADLKKADKSIVRAYARTGKSVNELMSLMSDETLMDAEEALELGFVDEISGVVLEMAAHLDRNAILAKYGIKYRKAPAAQAADQIQTPAGLRSKLASMSLKAQRIKAASGPK